MAQSRDYLSGLPGVAYPYTEVNGGTVLQLSGVPAFGQINYVRAVRDPAGLVGPGGNADVVFRVLTRHPTEVDSGADTLFDIIPAATLPAASASVETEYEKEYALHDDRADVKQILATVTGQPSNGQTLDIDGTVFTMRSSAADVKGFRDVLIGVDFDATWTLLASKVEALRGPTVLTYSTPTATFSLGGRADQINQYAVDSSFNELWDTTLRTALGFGFTGVSPVAAVDPLSRHNERSLWIEVDDPGVSSFIGFLLNITDLEEVGVYCC